MFGKYCMVKRGRQEFCRHLAALEGNTATLTNARRIWYGTEPPARHSSRMTAPASRKTANSHRQSPRSCCSR